MKNKHKTKSDSVQRQRDGKSYISMKSIHTQKPSIPKCLSVNYKLAHEITLQQQQKEQII